MSADSKLIDIGAQAERTALSWQRTGIGVIATGALVVRWAVTAGLPPWPGLLLTACGATTTLFVVRERYRRVLRTISTDRTPVSRFLVLGMTLFMLLVILAVAVGIGVELLR